MKSPTSFGFALVQGSSVAEKLLLLQSKMGGTPTVIGWCVEFTFTNKP